MAGRRWKVKVTGTLEVPATRERFWVLWQTWWMILGCKTYCQDILYPLALKQIAIDLDDGVQVNYNEFGKVVAGMNELNDKKAKARVRQFD